VVLAGDVGGRVLELWDEHKDELDYDQSHWGRKVVDYPFLYLDQDVLNAVLCGPVDPGHVVVGEQRLAPLPPFDGLRLMDARTLSCEYGDGAQPYVLHHYLLKPWREPAHHGIYSHLLRRLLHGSDVALKIPRRRIPTRLRRGPAGAIARVADNLRDYRRWHR
jgi:hypothetical protein